MPDPIKCLRDIKKNSTCLKRGRCVKISKDFLAGNQKWNKKALPGTVSHKDRLGQLYSGLHQFDARSVKLH